MNLPAGAREPYDVLVVGAGFAGSVMAERLAADAGLSVLLIDRRDHLGGNAHEAPDERGVLIHPYGPHIFHTNSGEIFDYLSRFTDWRAYEHRVRAMVGGKLVPMPINRDTLNALYGLELSSDAEAEAFLASRRESISPVRSMEDAVRASVGRELYETFFQGYSRKQWGIDPAELDKSVAARVPARTNTDDRYFLDRFQFMPRDGFGPLFARLVDHPKITVRLSTDFESVKGDVSWRHLVYTGPIDAYFGCRFGPLPYRSLRFEHRSFETEWMQPVAVINHPDPATPYTRVTETKHLTGQSHSATALTYEYPQSEGEPYYPMPTAEAAALYARYQALAAQERDLTLVGRLANYRYYNMDQVVGQALATYRRLKPKLAPL